MQDRRVALLIQATSSKNDELIDFVFTHRQDLSRFKIIASERTGALLRHRTGLDVTLLRGGPGADHEQLSELVAEEEVQAVILLRDPSAQDAHNPDVMALLDVCDAHQIAVATNLASASALLHYLSTHPDRMLYPALAWGRA
jgi:methylglyoxal synthase